MKLKNISMGKLLQLLWTFSPGGRITKLCFLVYQEWLVTFWVSFGSLSYEYLFKGISATSVPCERLFSDGRDIISQSRNRLTSKTVQAQICLKHYSKHKAFNLKEAEIAKLIMEKCSETEPSTPTSGLTQSQLDESISKTPSSVGEDMEDAYNSDNDLQDWQENAKLQ